MPETARDLEGIASAPKVRPAFGGKPRPLLCGVTVFPATGSIRFDETLPGVIDEKSPERKGTLQREAKHITDIGLNKRKPFFQER